jgi:hypothetical protein
MTRPLAALAAALAAAAPALAQPTSGVSADGTEIFRAMLHVAGIRPVSLYQLENMGPHERRQAILIVRSPDYGPRSGPPVDRIETARSIYRNGGAVLVMTNWPVKFEMFGAPDVAIAPDAEPDPNPGFFPPPAVPAPAQPLGGAVVAGARRLGFATDPVWDLFQGLNRVATETRSVIRMPRAQGPFRYPVAGFRPARSGYLAAGSGDPGPGGSRFLAVTDPNLFSNERLARDDADNWELALRVVTFLKAERRTVACFPGRRDSAEPFDALFLYGQPPLPIPHIPSLMNKLADAGNAMIDQAQQKDVLTRAVLGDTPERQSVGLRNALRGLAVAAAVWAAWFVLRRVWGTRQRAAPVPPPAPPGRPPAPDPDGVFDRRQLELLRRDNLFEPARDLVRGLMAAAGAPPVPPPEVPPIEFEGDPRFARRLRQVIGELWAVGYGDPKPVGARRWRELEPKIELARRAFENGAWRFAAAGSTA